MDDCRWEFWDRNLMGFVASPYNSLKMALVTKEVSKENTCLNGTGANGKKINPLQWYLIHLNLPGMVGYDPMFTWVAKLQLDVCIACGLFTFVDDERLIGPTEQVSW